MSEYKRLTKIKATSENTFPVYDMNGNIIMEKELFDAFIKEHNRLAELEDDLESGKLIRLPCKVGDTVWFLNRNYSISLKKDTVYEARVVRVYFEKDSNVCLAVQIKNEYGTTEFPRITEIGKTVFLTQAEAEAKLKELEDGR